MAKKFKSLDRMGEKQLEEFKKACAQMREEMKSNKNFARDFLIEAGIFLPDGTLHPNYK